MKPVVVDKIASVAQHSDLGHELRLSPEIPCEEGVLIAVRVLNNKTRYNQLELTSGRMATVRARRRRHDSAPEHRRSTWRLRLGQP
jgi:hypothetical protein